MRYKILYNFTHFTFRYINVSHMEVFNYECITAEEGVLILSQLKVERLVFLTLLPFNYIPIQLLQLKNIVCISSEIFPDDVLFPFELIKHIPTLEVIFIASGVSFQATEFNKIIPILCSPIKITESGGIACAELPFVICLKQPKCALGQPFTPSGPSSTWFLQLFCQYSSVE